MATPDPILSYAQPHSRPTVLALLLVPLIIIIALIFLALLWLPTENNFQYATTWGLYAYLIDTRPGSTHDYQFLPLGLTITLAYTLAILLVTTALIRKTLSTMRVSKP